MENKDDGAENSAKRKMTDSTPNPDEPVDKKSKAGIKMHI